MPLANRRKQPLGPNCPEGPRIASTRDLEANWVTIDEACKMLDCESIADIEPLIRRHGRTRRGRRGRNLPEGRITYRKVTVLFRDDVRRVAQELEQASRS